MSGILWVCGTPIGNLQDVTLRLVDVLRQVDVVAAEDTRRTLKLLNHLAIRKPLVSYHEHNALRQAPRLVRQLVEGAQVALVTDAGMPGISDPGAELVSAALDAGVDVRVVPGPSAVVAALAISGLPAQPFWFEGFLPRQPSRRRVRLQALQPLEATLVFFEAPHRLVASLREMAAILGLQRPCAVARELTKAHEELVRGSLGEVAARFEEATGAQGTGPGTAVRVGEFTIVVGPPGFSGRGGAQAGTGRA